ncbi:UDP-galactopyranose mutase [Methanobacterium sp. CWC-01]|uniref:UDP-galactopyranose mutase n=1 Tax=Methanobacterium aridiramus TaxID=2584467 RepID=UPI0025781DEE|nr:UDP-galactopyranose mutase [Methanobacterium sp. CWC-01]WJI10278.1 UDP-galactopyranose mutase [Methanobacterium sp. CWC-01]
MFDYLVVGAGLAGSVMSERIANVLSKSVLLIEKRGHVGGNCHDFFNQEGILVHKYGPHIFHTDSEEVWDYFSQFTSWHDYQHRVLGSVQGEKVPIPFNLQSLHQLFPTETANRLESRLVEKFGYGARIPILELKEMEDEELSSLADFIYEQVFLNYTIKQWGFLPEELDPSVTGRVPVYISLDDRYFQDSHQKMPREGYTPIFSKMLANPLIELRLNTDYKDLVEIDFDSKKIRLEGEQFTGMMIYTGRIDELFNYQYGELPYRSLRFKFETLDQEFYQEAGTVNYPNNHLYTRITEFKHLTGQKHPRTTIVREYPQAYQRDRNLPYYPIPQKRNHQLYQRYQARADEFGNLICLGRLGEYRYYNMSDVTSKALQVFQEKIAHE